MQVSKFVLYVERIIQRYAVKLFSQVNNQCLDYIYLLHDVFTVGPFTRPHPAIWRIVFGEYWYKSGISFG